MSPPLVLLSTVAGLAWFVGLPLVIGFSEETDVSLVWGFVIVWGTTAVVPMLMAALLVWDHRWWKRR